MLPSRPWLALPLPIAAPACSRRGPSVGGEESSPVCTPSPTARARNPLVSQIFTADPSAKACGDRVYVYTSHDADDQTDYHLVDYHAFSSDDLVNWQDHGAIITALDV